MEATWNNAKAILQHILGNHADPGDSLPTAFRTLIDAAVALWPDEGSGFTPPAAANKGGLAVWQVRKAQQLMINRISEDVPVASIASECGLSRSHFNRAFRVSVGTSPSQWLCKRRIEKAQWLLLNGDKDLIEIAEACGFMERCHFTRTFTRFVGMPPGVWRRAFGLESKSWKSVAWEAEPSGRAPAMHEFLPSYVHR